MNPKISVVIPVYKVEKYLGRCIESVLNQTYTNLEIILVDDGSPDRCGEICDEYAKRDNRILVIHKRNGGLSDARNAGIDVATSEYITFVDSDDYIHKQMYELMMKVIIKKSADICICGYKYVYEGENASETEAVYQNAEGKELDHLQAQFLYYENAELTLPLTVAWNKIYKTCAFKEIRYPKGKLNEDEYVTFKLLYQAQKIMFLDLPLYYYFQRDDSIMGQKILSANMDVFWGYFERLIFFETIKNDELWIKELKHIMHMLCRKRLMYANAGNSFDPLEDDYIIILKKYYNQIKAINIQIRGNARAECSLFFTCPLVYYHLWKYIVLLKNKSE